MKMKNALIFPFLLLCLTAFSQACSDGYFPFKEGQEFQMTTYSAAEELLTIADSRVVGMDVDEEEGMEETIATDMRRPNGDFSEGNYDIICKGDIYIYDAQSIVDFFMFKPYMDNDMLVSGNGLEFPKLVTVGQKLKDGDSFVQFSKEGEVIVTMNFNFSNRQISGAESIKTPAGTFDCLKYTFTLEQADGEHTETFKYIQWISKKVGVVRQEKLDKSGKMIQYSVLTKLVMP